MKYTPGELTKSILTLVLSVFTVFGAAFANDGKVDGLEWLGLIVAVVGGLLVFKVSNASEGLLYWKKAILGAVSVSLTAFITSLAGNTGVSFGDLVAQITPAQWFTLLAGIVSGLMIGIAPNAQVSDSLWEGPIDDEKPAAGYDSPDLADEDVANLPNPEELQRRALDQGE